MFYCNNKCLKLLFDNIFCHWIYCIVTKVAIIVQYAQFLSRVCRWVCVVLTKLHWKISNFADSAKEYANIVQMISLFLPIQVYVGRKRYIISSYCQHASFNVLTQFSDLLQPCLCRLRFKTSQLNAFCPQPRVFCYIEFTLGYLKNLKLFKSKRIIGACSIMWKRRRVFVLFTSIFLRNRSLGNAT